MHLQSIQQIKKFIDSDRVRNVKELSYSSLEINDLDVNSHYISLPLWHPYLYPTHGLQVVPMEYSFI